MLQQQLQNPQHTFTLTRFYLKVKDLVNQLSLKLRIYKPKGYPRHPEVGRRHIILPPINQNTTTAYAAKN